MMIYGKCQLKRGNAAARQAISARAPVNLRAPARALVILFALYCYGRRGAA